MKGAKERGAGTETRTAAGRARRRPVTAPVRRYPRRKLYTVVATLQTLGGTTSARRVPVDAS